MNKKFSTLMAGLLLATTVGTSNAQIKQGVISNNPSYEYLASIEDGKFYQLTNGEQVLIMDKTKDGTFILKFVNYNEAELAKSMWTVNYVKNNNENGLAFQFVNLTTGLPISYDTAKAIDVKDDLSFSVRELSQGVSNWSWLRGVEGAALMQSKPVEAYFGEANDSIMTLVNTPSGVVPVKYATKDYASFSNPNQLKFTVREATSVYLNAYDLNSMLQSRKEDKLHLTFNGEPANAEFGNEFTARDYTVVEAIGKNSLSNGVVSDASANLKTAETLYIQSWDRYLSQLQVVGNLNSETKELANKLGELESDIASTTTNLSNLIEEVEDKKAERDENLKEQGVLEQKICDYVQNNGDVVAKLAEAKEKKDNADKNFVNIQNRLDGFEADINAAKEEVKKWKVIYANAVLNGNPTEIQEALDGLNSATKSQEKAIEIYEKYFDGIYKPANNELTRIHQEYFNLVTLAAEGSILQSQYDAVTKKIDAANKFIQDNTVIIFGYKAELAEKEALKNEILGDYLDVLMKYPDAYRELSSVEAEAEAAKNAYFNARDRYLAVKHNNEHWFSLQAANGEYLMLDTAYMENNKQGEKHQKFTLAKHVEDYVDGNSEWNARDINGRFNYRFLYYPTVDSLVITVDGGNDKNETTKYWKDRSDSEISSLWGRNFVKLAYLTDNHQEVTVGEPESIAGTLATTLNTRIGLNLVAATPGLEIPKGVYFADIVNSTDVQKNGARLMLDLDGELTKITPAAWESMKFEDMPAAKWVIDGTTIYGGSPNIKNQESTESLNNGAYRVLDVKDGVVTVLIISYDYQNGVRVEETVKLTPVKEENKNGYYNQRFDKNTTSVFTFDYLNVTAGASIQVGTASNDTILRVAEGEATKFVLESAKDKNDKYGVANAFEKGLYYIRVNDANKLDNNYKYVTVSTVDGTEHLVVTNKKDKSEISSFYLKELNHVGDVHYYALISGDKKVGVMPASGLIMAEDITGETTTATFALNADTTEYYRTFTADELAKNMKFYRTADHAYLYADKGLLEFENKQTEAGDLANLEVIPAVTEGTIMPQYLVGKITKVVEGDTIWCNATASHKHETLADSLACPHTTIIKDTTFVNFMTNLKIDAKLDKANLFENKYSRVGFLDGYITDGKLYWTVEDKEYNVALNENKHHPAKFQFRLVEEGSNDFLIESESWGYAEDDKEKKNYLPFEGGVRPFENGGWLKIQNAVPVIVRTDYEDAVASGETFNVEAGSDITANETISTSNVVVAGVNGAVVVKGAEGKNVIVSTILGKVVANEVVSSDNATIAAPQGVVVVSVDGESFKVVVK